MDSISPARWFYVAVLLCAACASTGVGSRLPIGLILPGLISSSSNLPSSSPASSINSKDDDKPDFDDGDDSHIHAHWALLIAGSNGWGNYRHQADVCHSYHVLVKGGFLPEHIVVMMYDDIAQDPYNPYPGQIFNKPDGPDVYDGIKIDYKGDDVNSKTFLSVLRGNAYAVEGVGSGRVIASGPRDRVFLFYSDHGASGVLGMPTGPFLFADQLLSAIRSKKAAGGYKEMVAYIEACEAGSMFEGMLDGSLGLYVTTASSPFESSWGTYCPGGPASVRGEIQTCLGDLYSVAWMEDADASDLRSETLMEQFKRVEERTSSNYTYRMGSHVMAYGNLLIEKERAGDYEGMKDKKVQFGEGSTTGARQGSETSNTATTTTNPTAAAAAASTTAFNATISVRQRDADLVHLEHMASRGNGDLGAQSALAAERGRRASLDEAALRAASLLLKDVQLVAALDGHLVEKGMNAMKESWSAGSSSAVLVHSPMGRPVPGIPLVDSWECLREMVGAWETSCGALGQYGMRHTRFFANLCNAGVSPEALSHVLRGMPCHVAVETYNDVVMIVDDPPIVDF